MFIRKNVVVNIPPDKITVVLSLITDDRYCHVKLPVWGNSTVPLISYPYP